MVTTLGGYEDNLAAKGSALRNVTVSDGPGDKAMLDVTTPPCVCSANSTTTPLTAGSTWTGTAHETNGYGILYINVFSNVASATDGLVIEQSTDGTNWDFDDTYTIPANTGKTFSVQPAGKFFRVKYTNGGTNQTVFRLQSVLKNTGLDSSHRVQDSLNDDDDGRLRLSVLKLRTAANNYVSGTATSNGNFKVSLEEYDGSLNNDPILRISAGQQTGYSKINKFGAAPDFDTGDGEVTIWDGAEDNTAWELMNYVYSTTADIDSISSSDSGDTQDIEVQGLDTNGDLVTQTVTLNGQTRVALTTSLLRVFRAKNVGSTNLAGHVFVYVNGALTGGVPNTNADIRAVIQPENNQTEMALYTIPSGKKGYICGWYVNSAGASRSAEYLIKIKARPDGQVFQLKHKATMEDYPGLNHKYCMYNGPFNALTDIEMTAEILTSAVTSANIIAGFDLILVDD